MAPLAELGIHTVRVDVTDEADLVALVDRVVAESGRIDVLVNNAGYGSFGAIEDVSLDEARRQFEVNVFAAARLCQLVLPHLRARGSGASSTSPRSARGCTSRWAGGTTRRSTRWRASATACGSSSNHWASTSS
jgi:NAD(P)-dependent dehydrogenase (short-subunit alcohol dehydrogenase family)